MGNKMTSTPYGLKVKEHTNHADYKDVFDKTVFKIYYNESTHVWSIIANYDRLWSEGVRYNVGDTILSFTNTSDQEKTVLGQYDQEGTEVYRNIMYKIKCYQGEAGQGQTKQMIQITGGYSPKTYDKDTVCTDILHTHVSVYYNGKWHKAMYLVYDNASIAGCWMKKVGSLAITYAYPYWFLMCTKAGLKQGDRTYAARELIRSWSQDDYINLAFKEYKIRSKTKLGKGSYEKGEYLVKTIPSEDSIEVNFIVNGKIENKDTIILGISDVPYDFYNIRIDYDTNNWSLISINGHISYNKHNYKKDTVICSFSKDEQVTVTLIDNNDRYEKQQELNNDYEETVYDIVGLPDSAYLTVKNQTVVQELNPETGRTEKVYIDFDEKEMNQSDTMPVDFYNIRFIYTSIDNKWTIYSLCDYIKYGGRTYTKNKPILSFGTDEYDPEDPHPEIHLEIKDETEKYEIESTTTYTVKSVQVGSVSYKLWTVTIDKSLKIEKTVDTTIEPWISLRYYEAMYEPVVIDDLILEFSNVDMKWYLKSNNDNLYCAGTNYQKGKLITYWDYDYIQNLKYITVLSSSSEYGIELKKLTSGDVPYISEDIDEIYDEGLKICYSASKGLWEIISVNDETYHDGLQFLEGQVIVSFKDRTILDQFTILVSKEAEGEETFDNVLYTCYTGVDLINGVTTLTVNGMSWANKTATEANKSTIVTKDSAKSMYGYIWQKEEGPPPPPPIIYYNIMVYINYYSGSGSRYNYRTFKLLYNGSGLYVDIIVSTNYSSSSYQLYGTINNRIFFRHPSNLGAYTDNFAETNLIQISNSMGSTCYNNILPCLPWDYISDIDYTTGYKCYKVFNKDLYLTYELKRASAEDPYKLIAHKYMIGVNGNCSYISDIESNLPISSGVARLSFFGNSINYIRSTSLSPKEIRSQTLINADDLSVIADNPLDSILDSLYSEYCHDEGELYPGQTESYSTFLRFHTNGGTIGTGSGNILVDAPSSETNHLQIGFSPGTYPSVMWDNVEWIDSFIYGDYAATLCHPLYCYHYAERRGFRWEVYERDQVISNNWWALILNYKTGSVSLSRDTGINYYYQQDNNKFKELQLLYFNRYSFDGEYYSINYDEENDRFQIYNQISIFSFEYVKDVPTSIICKAFRYASDEDWFCTIHFQKYSDDMSVTSNYYIVDDNAHMINVYVDLFKFHTNPNDYGRVIIHENLKTNEVSYTNNAKYLCYDIRGSEYKPLLIFFSSPYFETSVTTFAVLGSVY